MQSFKGFEFGRLIFQVNTFIKILEASLNIGKSQILSIRNRI